MVNYNVYEQAHHYIWIDQLKIAETEPRHERNLKLKFAITMKTQLLT